MRGATIDEFDNGQVDVLLSDTEGCEYFCIKNLVSRPKVIVLEIWGNRYVNPYIDEIGVWMGANGYRFAGRDETDALFIKT